MVADQQIPDDEALAEEVANMLWRIEGNYHREGSGPGSRFEGQRLEVAQARAVIRCVRDAAYRAGYAEAVARLRDDDRYRNWWTAHPDRQFGTAYWAPDGRQHLADYLETVGPDDPDVTSAAREEG
jgi:hypothetical protein